ncbi:four helix bundle protein [Photobacterium damselae]|uniref:four helix bundle protein n=1 Tax=Photobacterium damselae TaxID=38293 RepID=UPI004067C5E1
MRQLHFEKLEVWKRSSVLSVKIVKELAGCRNFAFVDQLMRSSLSVPSNIAEGEERETPKESARFLYYAKGSCGEMVTQIYIGAKLGYFSMESANNYINESKQISAMLARLIQIRKGQGREKKEEKVLGNRL